LADQALRLGFFRREAVDVLVEQADQRVVIGFRADRVIRERLAATETNSLTIELDLVDLARPDLVQEFRIRYELRLAAAHTGQALHDRQQDDDNDDED
jgi:hypothetical protein